MDEPRDDARQPEKDLTPAIERFVEQTFEKLPTDKKVLIALFAALNSSQSVTRGFDLPERLREIVRSDCGPLAGQSVEVNWLKGVADGMTLITDHA